MATQRIATGGYRVAGERRVRQRRPHPFLRVMMLMLLAVAAAYVVMVIQVYRIGSEDHAQRADTIVVLGAAQWAGKPSPVLQARLDHALDLYRQGLASHIITTGGIGKGDRYSEADVAAEYLNQQGVPLDSIRREREGQDTKQSMAAVSAIMQQGGWHSAIMVSDPFHMMRVSKMAADFGITAYTSPTRTSPISADPGWELQYTLREPISYLAYLLGLKD